MENSRPKLLVITGAPATGKTTLFEKITNKTATIGFSKDSLKETMFDSVSKLDLELSKSLGLASFSLLFRLIEQFGKKNKNLIVEGNFIPKYNEKQLKEIVCKYNMEVMQILCTASPKKVIERLESRKKEGNRHPGHFDLGREIELSTHIEKGDYRFFDIPTKEKHILNNNEFNKQSIDSAIDRAIKFLQY